MHSNHTLYTLESRYMYLYISNVITYMRYKTHRRVAATDAPITPNFDTYIAKDALKSNKIYNIAETRKFLKFHLYWNNAIGANIQHSKY